MTPMLRLGAQKTTKKYNAYELAQTYQHTKFL